MQIPTHSNEGMVVLSPTRVGGGIRCLRKHTLADTISYLPTGVGDAAALEFGTRMHKAGSIYWGSGDSAISTEYLRGCEWPLNDKHTLGLALQCWGGYAVAAKPMPYDTSEEWRFLAVEERVLLDVRPGVVLSFQLDRLMQGEASGRLALFDLKTAARCDARWAKQWPRDLQMKLYAECVVRKYGRPLDWLVVEGLDKSTGMLTPVVLPDFSDAVRAEAWRDFEWVAQHDEALLRSCKLADGSIDSERLAVRALSETPHSPAECFSYGGTCPYLPLCDAEPGERIALLREGYTYHEPEYV